VESVLAEWGMAGVEALRERVSVLVIVDVLSFSTAVDAAVSRGAVVFPFPYGDKAAAQAAADRVGAVLAQPRQTAGGQFSLSPVALIGFRGGRPGSCYQGCNKGAEQGFAASARIVHELEEAEAERQLVLRDAPVRAQPGAQQRPKTLHRVDVDLAKAVAVFVAGVFTAPMADRLVPVAPGWQARVDAILVRVDKGARGDSVGDDRLDRFLLHVGQHMQHHLAAALDQAKDGRLVLVQRAASRRAGQLAAPSEPPLLATAAGCPLCPATT